MPLIKTKVKKVTPTKIIKTEPVELMPLGQYVDDRVELIRQTFMNLKPKTIKSITPDFLQGKSIESIQEYCLDELLGISKKRLLSIINATQCPSDTESSDESDCKNVDEHISLEEISSDSGEEGASKRKKLRKKARSAKLTTEKKNGADPPKKEYSVLELLELQARARAIRSQLALEPVTKIELDSDNSESSSETDKDENKKSKEVTTGSNEVVSKETTQPKRVRLVRNFRKRNSDEEEDKDEQQNNESKKDSSPKRDSSPEVVTIIPEREILCISSDSDDDEKTVAPNPDKEEIKVEKEDVGANKEIPVVEVIPEEPGTPEDGEIFEEEEEEKIVEEKEVEKEIPAQVEEEILEPKEKEKTPETSYEEKSIEFNNMDDDTLLVNVDIDELNDEMTENFDEPEELPKSKSPEIFEIGDSSEEENEKEKLIQKELTATSFHERWLESKKVSKILATSRLANRVREKLKQKNKKQSESDNSEVSSPTPTEIVPEVVPSNCEEGSVSHFEEIGTNE